MRAHSIPDPPPAGLDRAGGVSSGLGVSPAMPTADRQYAEQLGMPGGIDTPTAEMMPDATLGATVAYST